MNKIQLRNPSFKEIQNLSKLMKLKSIPWVDKMENRLEIMVNKKKTFARRITKVLTELFIL